MPREGVFASPRRVRVYAPRSPLQSVRRGRTLGGPAYSDLMRLQRMRNERMRYQDWQRAPGAEAADAEAEPGLTPAELAALDEEDRKRGMAPFLVVGGLLLVGGLWWYTR